MQSKWSCLVSAFGFLLIVGGCGSVLTFEFDGEVKDFRFTTSTGLGALSLAIGDPVTGRFSYDNSVADLNSEPNVGRYPQEIPSGVEVRVSGSAVTFDSYEVDIHDDYLLPGGQGPFDLFEVQGFSQGYLDGVPLSLPNSDLDFSGAPPATLDNDALPLPGTVENWPGDVDLQLMEANPPANRISVGVSAIRRVLTAP